MELWTNAIDNSHLSVEKGQMHPMLEFLNRDRLPTNNRHHNQDPTIDKHLKSVSQ